ncbi:ribosome biogenesis GTPase RsgA [Gammaproteobacteria bacterium 45_16_T64]|nr:ribosome biogenesis GTPase RsgA [Gammaproteobacteria bacterium 45_16_T64]
MAKRKLTRKQNWRIQKVQEEKAKRLEKKMAKSATDEHLGPELQGLVVSHFGTFVEIEPWNNDSSSTDADTGSEAISLDEENVRCHFRANVGSIVTGDRVVWRLGKDGYGVIEAVLSRESLLSRPDPRGKLKPVAANIDFIVLVITPEPTPSSMLIDRYLVAAELQNIDVKILLNKTDLLTEKNKPAIESLLSTYESIGYEVMRSSTVNTEGLALLKTRLDNCISVFVGQSGVGKSSLVNSLLPGVDLKVAELSEGSKLGRHTTTNARLFHFPDGGELIDSPGIREFGLWHLSPDNVIDGYRDFQLHVGMCRFRDCKHDREPGCALQLAVEKGEVSAQRFTNYFAIVDLLVQEGN